MCRLFVFTILMIYRTLAFRTGAGTCFATVEDVNTMSFSFYEDAYGADFAVLTANVSSYTPNSGVLLTVQGGPDPTLKGILLYATTGNATDSRVGTFTNLTTKYHIANCGGDSTVTHTNRDRVPLPTFQWVAPPPTTGTVNFHAVISIGPQGDTSLWTILKPLTLTEGDGSQVESSSVIGSTGVVIDSSSSSAETNLSSSTPVIPSVASTGSRSSSSAHHIPTAGVSSSTGTAPPSPPPPSAPSSAISTYLNLSTLSLLINISISIAICSTLV
jgi:hypothetical protein